MSGLRNLLAVVAVTAGSVYGQEAAAPKQHLTFKQAEEYRRQLEHEQWKVRQQAHNALIDRAPDWYVPMLQQNKLFTKNPEGIRRAEAIARLRMPPDPSQIETMTKEAAKWISERFWEIRDRR